MLLLAQAVGVCLRVAAMQVAVKVIRMRRVFGVSLLGLAMHGLEGYNGGIRLHVSTHWIHSLVIYFDYDGFDI